MPVEIIYTTLEHEREKIYIVYHQYDKNEPVEHTTYYRTTITVFEYYERYAGKKEDFGGIVFPPNGQHTSFSPTIQSRFHLAGRSYEFILAHTEGQPPQPEIENKVTLIPTPNDGVEYRWERGKWVAA